MAVIHKACRPKRDYINPILCAAGSRLYDAKHRAQRPSPWFNWLAIAASCTSWSKVTCKNCLKLKGKRRF